MRVLVGILACEKDRWAHDSVLQMWVPNNVDNWEHAGHLSTFRFFVGAGRKDYPNEFINTEVADENGTGKTRRMIKYSLDKSFDYLFKCDVDTYVRVCRLLESGFEKRDWLGGYGSKDIGPYGGSGYWLNREAMSQLQDDVEDARTPRPWDEDRWVGANLIYKGLSPDLDERYDSIGEPHNIREDFITSHLYARRGSYSGPVAPPPVLLSSNDRLQLMHQYHQRFKEIDYRRG
jgi:hypothetical protein